MLAALALTVLHSLSAPSLAGTLTFSPEVQLSLRRSADGYTGALGSEPVRATVRADGVVQLVSGQRLVGTVRRTAQGFELARVGARERLVTATLVPPDVHARGPKAPQVTVPVVPGVSLGAVTLGQSLAELRALGPVKAHPSGQFGDAVQVLGPYTVTLDQGRVSAIEVTPSESDVGLLLRSMVLPPGALADEVAKGASGCAVKASGEGGEVIACAGVVLKQAPRCRGRDAAGVCVGWDVSAPVASVQVIGANE